MITLKKSIEVLDLNVRQRNPSMPLDVFNALKLGIEAMKEVTRARLGNPALDGELLPGEAEGDD